VLQRLNVPLAASLLVAGKPDGSAQFEIPQFAADFGNLS
jgi:hypothetical protein